jgi:hypothetical protein
LSGAPESYFPLGDVPGLTHEHYTVQKKLAWDKRSSLSSHFVNYREKSFMKLALKDKDLLVQTF